MSGALERQQAIDESAWQLKMFSKTLKKQQKLGLEVTADREIIKLVFSMD